MIREQIKNLLLLVPPNFFLSQMLSYWCFLQKISQASELLLSVSLNFRTVYSLQKCGLSYTSNLGLYWMLVKPQDKSNIRLSICSKNKNKTLYQKSSLHCSHRNSPVHEIAKLYPKLYIPKWGCDWLFILVFHITLLIRPSISNQIKIKISYNWGDMYKWIYFYLLSFLICKYFGLFYGVDIP